MGGFFRRQEGTASVDYFQGLRGTLETVCGERLADTLFG
jgi:hypothetical protein